MAKSLRNLVKRINIIILLLISALTPLFVGCGPSNEEKILMGKWEGTMMETDEDGEEMIYRIAMTFKTEVMSIKVTCIEPEMGEVSEMTVSGEWMADKEEITIFADKESAEIKFTPQVKSAAMKLGVSLSDFEDLFTSMMKEQFGVWDDIKIYSISEESVAINFDGSKITLHRK